MMLQSGQTVTVAAGISGVVSDGVPMASATGVVWCVKILLPETLRSGTGALGGFCTVVGVVIVNSMHV